MANVRRKVWSKTLQKTRRYTISWSSKQIYDCIRIYSDAIFQGEMVEPLGTGNIQRHGPNTSDAVVGVFNGCFYTDPTTKKPTFRN